MKGKRTRMKNGFQKGHICHAMKPECDDNNRIEHKTILLLLKQFQRIDMNIYHGTVYQESGIFMLKTVTSSQS